MSFLNAIFGRREAPAPARIYKSMPSLALYHYQSCFFCKRVRKTIAKFGLEVELRDIHEEPHRRSELAAALDRTTVPVLWIQVRGEDGEVHGEVQWLPESRDIVTFLTDLGTGRSLESSSSTHT